LAENDTPKLENPFSPVPILKRMVAWTDCEPFSVPSVQLTDARPTASVMAEPADKVPLPLVTAQLTVSPATGSPAAFVKETVSGVGRA
jgi:hypothetical protein